ncbi:MAG: hypothetical protein ACI93R_001200 [Flavobacteriales bacterium]|jgi:hypothetical protein
MSNAIQQIIRHAEQQKLQMEMSILFKNNMEMLKNRFPMVYKLMQDFKPSNHLLKLDPNDQINLIDVEKKCYFYNEFPQEECKKQVQLFKKKARVRRFNVTKNKPYNDEHIHIPALNAMIEEYEECKVERINSTPKTITNLIVTGIGLGHHIPELINEFDVQNIIIHERCIDSFFASLHVLDWENIADRFTGQYKSIGFCIGVEPRLALSQLEESIKRTGLHAQIFSYLYQHSSRKGEVEFIKTYQEEFQRFMGGLGYYDDEQIGLAHAYHNLQSEHAAFISKKTHKRSARVMLIGNGPSLDEHKDYLDRNKNNSILVSCGTALSSLLRMGIKPDFHVEMERCIMVNDIIQHFSTAEEREGITLLCLHTVAPDTLASFSDACYAIKPNDAGGPMVTNYHTTHAINQLLFCNPTVSNCGLSFIVSMGFEEIHLVGVDLGVLESTKHHSKFSVYNEMESFAKKNNIDYTIFDKERSSYCEGNLGGTVMAMPTLQTARISIERYLKLIRPAFPNLRVINSNHGAKIAGTESVKLDEISDCPTIDKTKEISEMKKSHFHYYKNSNFENKKNHKHLTYLLEIKEQLKLQSDISSDIDLYREISRVYKTISAKKDKTAHYMLRGSLNVFFGSIVEHSMYCKNTNDFKVQVSKGTRHYNRFIDEVYKRLISDPFKKDATHSGYVKAMKESKKNKEKA